MSRFISRSSRLLLTLCLGLPAALPSYSQAGNADEQTFVKLQHDWAEARKKGDVAFLERFYAKEFTVGTANGTESSRAQDLEMFSSGRCRTDETTPNGTCATGDARQTK
jgi:Domain of unknown function (DUF4440)